jgi:hypothetical protein
MKKIFSILLAVMASVFVCNAAFAKKVDTIKPESMVQVPAGSSTAVCDAYPTCINITNKSSYTIRIDVPSLAFRAPLNQQMMQPLYANDYNARQVILTDWNSVAFYNAIVPNHQNLIVYDRLGKLAVKIG